MTGFWDFRKGSSGNVRRNERVIVMGAQVLSKGSWVRQARVDAASSYLLHKGFVVFDGTPDWDLVVLNLIGLLRKGLFGKGTFLNQVRLLWLLQYALPILVHPYLVLASGLLMLHLPWKRTPTQRRTIIICLLSDLIYTLLEKFHHCALLQWILTQQGKLPLGVFQPTVPQNLVQLGPLLWVFIEEQLYHGLTRLTDLRELPMTWKFKLCFDNRLFGLPPRFTVKRIRPVHHSVEEDPHGPDVEARVCSEGFLAE